MRIIAVIAGLSFVVLLTVTVVAQRGGGQNQPAPSITETKIVTAAEVAALVAGTPKDRNGNANMIRLTPYNVNMEHRIMNQAASVHETEAELFYVIDGAGTLVTGGKLIEERRTNPENLTGTGIEGGVSKRVAKGDWILVPAGQPHQYPAVEAGGLTLMALHLPKKIS
jgi:mannose-6-phosphate isomerase-like protein (cupin superfamily)